MTSDRLKLSPKSLFTVSGEIPSSAGSSKQFIRLQEALSVLMLCAPMSIFTSGSSALLGRPRCGLSICLSLLAIFNTLFRVYADFFPRENGQKQILEVRLFQKGSPFQ